MVPEGVLPEEVEEHPPRAADLGVAPELLNGAASPGGAVVGRFPVGLPVAGKDLPDIPGFFDPVEVRVEPGLPDLDHGGPEGLGRHAATRLLEYSSQCASRNPRIPRPGL